uniref:SbcC/MukB-like Walker B domain-containing protein n=1 Tax=Mycolicibacterium llatzerense TaxID=280871 RepID=UPI000AC63CDA
DVNAARIALQQAHEAAKDARAAATRAQDAQQTAAAVRAERLRQCDAHRAALVEHLSRLGSAAIVRVFMDPVGTQPSSSQLQTLMEEVTSARDEITSWKQQRSSSEVRLRTTAQEVETARAAVQASHGAVESAWQRTNAAFTVLHQARDRVSALGPPSLDAADIAAAWARLTAWGEAQGATVSVQIDALTVSTNESQAARQTARDELERAETSFDHANDVYTEASIAAQQTADARDVAMARRDELAHALADRASSTEIGAQLDLVKELESRLTEVGRQLRDARAAAAEANRAVTQADTAIEDSWRLLRRVRDPLTAYGAPEVNNTDLSGDWQRLLTWAATEAQERAAAAATQLGIAAAAEGRADTAAAALDEALAAHHIEIPGVLRAAEVAERVPAAVASAVTATKGLLQRAEERLLESQTMRVEMANAEESAQVARALSNLMHTQNFPRWLISSALDALLLDASHILLELSGGQFELTRDDRDLLVVDHNDADMSRPVKTLSGGETFQASLALALALSEQVTALSAVGASKLESIFLDEGFGTLDETTLDVVAGTLENLAASGFRMVGVITHVAALAERIPLRFQVNRDSAGSHIERIPV